MGLPSLDRLEDSHRRHDGVLSSLLAAARRLAAGRPDPGDVDAVHAAVTFLEDVVPRHFLDEEGSVFPRLSTRRPELAAELARLSAEHPTHIALQRDVAAAARGLDGDARPAHGKALLDAATRLADAHRAHRDRKDAIFRAASEALTTEDDLEIFAEMTTRRDRDDGPALHSPKVKATATTAAPKKKLQKPAAKVTAKSSPAKAKKSASPSAKQAPAKRPTAKKPALKKPIAKKSPAKRLAAKRRR